MVRSQIFFFYVSLFSPFSCHLEILGGAMISNVYDTSLIRPLESKNEYSAGFCLCAVVGCAVLRFPPPVVD